jgi:chromosome segregation protein
MFLKKLEIQGFKSFAKKNVLVFPGQISKDRKGLTAVVGPNGSGKSNISDAVRWVMGEQSMKTLRGKKSEDIIFSGSQKKGKLSMAEVSLHLDNSDKQADIDYSELLITRRIYRNGDSDYLINNSKVRLADVHMLLAKLNFGQKTYSVIGQGTVDAFLNSSLADRKEFFDEATGVKQYQIKRDDALNKLRSSYKNLSQAQMLIIEIEPRLNSLTRQVNKLNKREGLEISLKELQYNYYSKVWHENNDIFVNYNKDYAKLELDKKAKDALLAGLKAELKKIEVESMEDESFSLLQNQLAQAQAKKDDQSKKLARLNAQIEMKLEAQGKFDLSFLLNKKEELEKEIQSTSEEISSIEKVMAAHVETDNNLAQEKITLEDEINRVKTELDTISSTINARANSYDDISKNINIFLEELLEKVKVMKGSDDINEIKQIIEKIEKRLHKALKISTKEDQALSKQQNDEWNIINKSLNDLVVNKEDLIRRINENYLKISSQKEKVRLLLQKKENTKAELLKLQKKIEQNTEGFDFSGLNKEKEELEKVIKAINKEIFEIKENISDLTIEEKRKKEKLFSVQRQYEAMQSEIDVLAGELNALRVNAARYETKLENLELEIREEYGNLKKIKSGERSEVEDEGKIKVEIGKIKRQLELIGGIDPQVEAEYKDTKERYDFLTTQVDDLNKAVTSLEKIIKELDVVIKEKFDKEFKVISKNFEKYFKIVFNGGSAKIEKVVDDLKDKKNEEKEDGEELEDKVKKETEDSLVPEGIVDPAKIKFLKKHNATGLAGVEIQAHPPGKKISSISMLSGGERALTAIALICAIISANPAPFVFLDEVDAALDEANSERLASILEDLASKTQFIVITHNRASMRKADVLYGVTMGDDGVSKIFSVKLDEVGAAR